MTFSNVKCCSNLPPRETQKHQCEQVAVSLRELLYPKTLEHPGCLRSLALPGVPGIREIRWLSKCHHPSSVSALAVIDPEVPGNGPKVTPEGSMRVVVPGAQGGSVVPEEPHDSFLSQILGQVPVAAEPKEIVIEWRGMPTEHLFPCKTVAGEKAPSVVVIAITGESHPCGQPPYTLPGNNGKATGS